MVLPFTEKALAQEKKETKDAKMSIEKRAQNQVNRLSEKLELSKEQADQLYDLKISEAKERKVEMEKLQAKRKAKDETHKLRMKSILSEQQYENYLEIMGAAKTKRKMRRKQMRKKNRTPLEEK